MTLLAWPLERNYVRGDSSHNAFGMVRNGGSRAHQGWDLSAANGTPCYAIADGIARVPHSHHDYGRMIVLEFEHRGQRLYAAYCHLSLVVVRDNEPVNRGERIGYTGSTGNAASLHSADRHLHFEIRTTPMLGKGLAGRVDPATLYGRAPIGWTVCAGHGQKICLGPGLKLSRSDLDTALK